MHVLTKEEVTEIYNSVASQYLCEISKIAAAIAGGKQCSWLNARLLFMYSFALNTYQVSETGNPDGYTNFLTEQQVLDIKDAAKEL